MALQALAVPWHWRFGVVWTEVLGVLKGPTISYYMKRHHAKVSEQILVQYIAFICLFQMATIQWRPTETCLEFSLLPFLSPLQFVASCCAGLSKLPQAAEFHPEDLLQILSQGSCEQPRRGSCLSSRLAWHADTWRSWSTGGRVRVWLPRRALFRSGVLVSVKFFWNIHWSTVFYIVFAKRVLASGQQLFLMWLL